LNNKDCDSLVNGFKDLCNEPFYASISNWLKSKEVKRLQSNYKPFSPSIDSRSRVLDAKRIKAFNTNREDDWSISEIPDERDFPTASRSKLASLLIEESPTFDARVQWMYEKRRQSLDKLELIKHKELGRIKEECPFKPVITNYSRRHSVKALFNVLVLVNCDW